MQNRFAKQLMTCLFAAVLALQGPLVVAFADDASPENAPDVVEIGAASDEAEITELGAEEEPALEAEQAEPEPDESAGEAEPEPEETEASADILATDEPLDAQYDNGIACRFDKVSGRLDVYPANGMESGWLSGDDQGDQMGLHWHGYLNDIVEVHFHGTIYADEYGCWAMFANCPKLVTADLSGLDTSHATIMNRMFKGCSSLTTLILPDDFNTYNVTSMDNMFEGCAKLASLDVSSWDTKKVAGMECMFQGCSSLTELDVSDWDVSAVWWMDYMFKGCTKLRELDVSGWDTTTVSRSAGMFQGCSALTELDLSNWRLWQMTNTANMFQGCTALTSLNLSGWDMWQVTDMSSMFQGCSNLSTLDISGWDTSELMTMTSAFEGCSSLAALDVKGWVTENVTDMSRAFKGCSSLKSLDLSGWDTVVASKMASLFDGCTGLTSVTLGSGFSFDGAGSKRLCNLPSGTWTGADKVPHEPETVPNNCADTYKRTAPRKTNPLAVTPKATQVMTYQPEDKTLARNVTVSGAKGAVTYANVSAGDTEFFDLDPKTGALTIPAWFGVGTHTIKLAVSAAGDASYLPATTTVSYKVQVKRAPISGATVAALASKTYSGKAFKPTPKVMWGADVLERGVDYTVSYKNNVNAGTASVVLTGVGNFTGTKTVNFRIKPLSIAKATVTAPDRPYTSAGAKTTPKVVLGGKTLKKGTDYTVSYANNAKVTAKAKVTVKGTGNYTGTKTAYFRVAFADVPAGTASYAAIHRANDLGLISGYSGVRMGEFGPTDNITRGQIAVILWKLAGRPAAGTGAKAFSDVGTGSYCYKAVSWASGVGIVSGYKTGKFGINDNVTREQLAVMIANYARKVGKLKVSGSAKDFSAIADAGSVSSWAVGSVGWCYKEGIFLTQGGRLKPQGLADRATTAQMAVDLYGLLG